MFVSFALLIAAFSLSLYMGPRPEATTTFRDWATGCDNERNCSAIALAPVAVDIDGPFDYLQIQIEQASAHHLDPVVSIKLPTAAKDIGQMMLRVDGSVIMLPESANGRFVFTGMTARDLLQKMRSGHRATLRDREGAVIAVASLMGLTAALLRIDEQQGKDGTPRALVRTGKRVPYDDLPGYRVSLTRLARSNRPPASPDAKAIAQFSANNGCDSGRSPTPPRILRLDDEHTLMIAPWHCGSGAYNLYSTIMIVNDAGKIRPAIFDYDNGITGDGPSNVLVNVAWDDENRVLESFIKHRHTGNCGRVDRYIWSGEKFMLSEQWAMPECRMAYDKIRTWRVDVVDR
jgi:hypothetical protein